jgi:hypothetical protein
MVGHGGAENAEQDTHTYPGQGEERSGDCLELPKSSPHPLGSMMN